MAGCDYIQHTEAIKQDLLAGLENRLTYLIHPFHGDGVEESKARVHEAEPSAGIVRQVQCFAARIKDKGTDLEWST